MLQIKKIKQSTFNLFFAVLIAVIGIGMLAGTAAMRRSTQNERDSMNRNMELQTLSDQFIDASDLLTNKAREFSVSGSMDSLNQYWNEAKKTRTREAVLLRLKQMNLHEHDIRLMEQSKSMSDELMITEIRSMWLMLSANEKLSQIKIPEVIGYKASRREINESASSKREISRNIMFEAKYANRKKEIMAPVIDFKKRMDIDSGAAMKKAKQQLDMLQNVETVFVFLIAASMGLMFLFYYKMNAKPLQNYTSKLRQLDTGELNLIPEGTAEFRELAEEFNKLQQRVVSGAINLNASLAYNKSIFEQSPIGKLIYTQDGECISANQAAADILGSTVAQLVGQNFNILQSWKSNGLLEVAHKTLDTGEKQTLETHFVSTFGKLVWIDTCFSMLQSGEVSYLLTTIIDIEKQKVAEEEIKLFFDTTLDMLCIAGFDGYFRRLSPGWTKVLGWSEEELLARPYVEFIYKEDVEATLEKASTLSVGGNVANFNNRYRCKDGSYRWLAWNSVANQEREIIIGSVRDITEQMELQQKLIKAKDAAEVANKAKSEFLANMSHEIRTPLNSVLGFSELLMMLSMDEKQRSYSEAIYTSGKSLLTLINDILDLSKIEAGKMEIQYLPIDPLELANEMKIIFQQRMKEKNLEFQIYVDEDMPKSLLLDETRVRQILLNLVGNAVKFTDHGFIKLSISKEYRNGDLSLLDLTIQVQDTGIGVRLEDQKRIFESFHQQSGQNTKKYEGTGLGLAICHKLTAMMGGEISIESKVGSGSVFTVKLHKVSIAVFDSGATDYLHKDKDVKGVVFEGVKVLVVDDVEGNQQLVQEILSRIGITVLIAENGLKAIDIVEKELPDLILMDIRMPELEGVETTKRIKSMYHIPVIALTASVVFETQAEILDAGFDGYLSKPVVIEHLVEELTHHLKYKIVNDGGFGKQMEDAQMRLGDIVESSERENKTDTGDRTLSAEASRWLVENVLPAIMRLEKVIKKSDLNEFADLLHNSWDKHRSLGIIEYADTLEKAVNRFDIPATMEILSQLKNFINSTKDGGDI